MKEEKWLREKWLTVMSLADENYIEEADPTRPESVRVMRRRKLRRALAAAACFGVLIFAGWGLYAPFPTKPNVSRYRESAYYPLIQQLAALTFDVPEYRNNFEMIMADVREILWPTDGYMWEVQYEAAAPMNSGSTNYAESPAENYKEVTDNQVAGVVEADRIKRSDRYIYYLDGGTLKVFTIDGEASAQIGAYEPCREQFYNTLDWEFYLSEDCKTVTLVMSDCYNEAGVTCMDIAALDVSDPTDIREKAYVSITGSKLSSRMTDGRLLLMMKFAIDRKKLDYDDPSTFLPQITRDGRNEPLPMEAVEMPETVNAPRYTTVFMLDEKTLETEGAAAFLSYSEDVYVSQEHIFLTHVYADQKKQKNGAKRDGSHTKISCLSYAGAALESMGSVDVRGYVRDQYSMDEYEGLLRVVTTTNEAGDEYWRLEYDMSRLAVASGRSSASIYCIDLDTWKVVGKVEDFAPEGEEVRSVRFDRSTAYVCTSVERVDPVFFFDLSDPEHITYKDTGTIEGFSTSLVDFGEGRLLGIGVGELRGSFKAEIYEETEEGVCSVCAYARENGHYAEDYKAYYIDREHQLLGLGLNRCYVVLYFDGYDLAELLEYPLGGREKYMRGVYIDGWMYMFGEGSFAVEKLFK